jgi:hypothetical protein
MYVFKQVFKLNASGISRVSPVWIQADKNDINQVLTCRNYALVRSA